MEQPLELAGAGIAVPGDQRLERLLGPDQTDVGADFVPEQADLDQRIEAVAAEGRVHVHRHEALDALEAPDQPAATEAVERARLHAIVEAGSQPP